MESKITESSGGLCKAGLDLVCHTQRACRLQIPTCNLARIRLKDSINSGRRILSVQRSSSGNCPMVTWRRSNAFVHRHSVATATGSSSMRGIYFFATGVCTSEALQHHEGVKEGDHSQLGEALAMVPRIRSFCQLLHS